MCTATTRVDFISSNRRWLVPVGGPFSGSERYLSTTPASSQNPTTMPRINVPPAMMAEIKEAMASTSEKILQS